MTDVVAQSFPAPCPHPAGSVAAGVPRRLSPLRLLVLANAVSIGGNNLGRFDNADFESLIADAQAETDDVARGELYADSERLLLNDETHAIPLNWYVGDQVFRDNVVNADMPPLGLYLWERVAFSG